MIKPYLEKNLPLISVIILNYNGKKYLNNCVHSLLESNYSNLEIIVVDNNSSDGSIELVEKEFPRHKIIILKLKKNYGFSEGNNRGAQLATGDYLFFLNNDTVIDSMCITNLLNLMESDKSVGAAQAMLLSSDGDRIDSAGCFFDKFGFVYVRGLGEKTSNRYNQKKEILYAKGAAIIVRMFLWRKLKGFDPLFFMYFEEADFCWRTWLFGYKVVLVPNAKVYHVGMATLKRYPEPLVFQEARNRLVMLIKNYETKNFFRYVPILNLAYMFNFLKYIIRKDCINALAVIKSLIWCLQNFNDVWKKKLNVQVNFRIVPDSDLIENLFCKSFIPKNNNIVKSNKSKNNDNFSL